MQCGPVLSVKAMARVEEPPISLERMLELTANAEVDGRKFDGIDYFLFYLTPTPMPVMMNLNRRQI